MQEETKKINREAAARMREANAEIDELRKVIARKGELVTWAEQNRQKQIELDDTYKGSKAEAEVMILACIESLVRATNSKVS